MFVFLFFIVTLLSTVLSDDTNKTNIAVYWGQNSGGSQKRLSEYCNDDVDIVLLAFLSSFPTNLELNLASLCADKFSSGLSHCKDVADDIKSCQNKGKKIFLSMGGLAGKYGFSDDQQAKDFASTLWNKFGGGQDQERPFDDAIIDGFDLDIEGGNKTGYVALAKTLKSYFQKDNSKSYYLSTSPQCPYPDALVGDVLSQVEVDFAFIQFYNNYCDLGKNFNFETWQNYAQNTSPNKDIKLLVGVLGSQGSGGSGYQEPSQVKQNISKIKTSKNFAGISIWDASSAELNVVDNKNYISQMKGILDDNEGNSNAAKQAKIVASTFIG